MMAGDNHVAGDVKVKNRCWNAYVTSSLRDLYIKTELCDTVLTTGVPGDTGGLSSNRAKTLLESELMVKKSIFPVHKCVIGAVSPYLKSLFKQDKDCNEFRIPLVTGDALRYVLDFIYSGESDVPHEHIDDVYAASIVLQIDSLLYQIKKAIPKPASHWEKVRIATAKTLAPYKEVRGGRKRDREEKSEERGGFGESYATDTDRCSTSRSSSSVHSNEDLTSHKSAKMDTSTELFQHLIMDATRRAHSTPRSSPRSLSPAAVLPDPVPFLGCSQPVFPGQEEEDEEADPEPVNLANDLERNHPSSIKPEPKEKNITDDSNTKSEDERGSGTRPDYKAPIVIKPSMDSTRKADSTPKSSSRSSRSSAAASSPVPFSASSQPVFPGQEEEEPVNLSSNPERSSSNNPEPGYQAPIVIEPSMAYNLYEMARGGPAEEAAVTARYGFTGNSTRREPAMETESDAGPSASSVLRSLLKRKEHLSLPSGSSASGASPPSASSTLRAMLKQHPVVPPSSWSLPSSSHPTSTTTTSSWPQPPPVSSNRLKALLGSAQAPVCPPIDCTTGLKSEDNNNRKRDLNSGGRGGEEKQAEKESRKRRSGEVASELYEVLMKQRNTGMRSTTPPPTVPPPPPHHPFPSSHSTPTRTMPAALRPIRTCSESKATSQDSFTPAKATSTTSRNLMLDHQPTKHPDEVRNELKVEEREERQPSPHHPILFSILKEQNLLKAAMAKKQAEEKETDREEARDSKGTGHYSPHEPLTLPPPPALSLTTRPPTTTHNASSMAGQKPVFTPAEEFELARRINALYQRSSSAERGDVLKIANEYAFQLGKRDSSHPLSRKWYYGFVKRMREVGCRIGGGSPEEVGAGGGAYAGQQNIHEPVERYRPDMINNVVEECKRNMTELEKTLRESMLGRTMNRDEERSAAAGSGGSELLKRLQAGNCAGSSGSKSGSGSGCGSFQDEPPNQLDLSRRLQRGSGQSRNAATSDSFSFNPSAFNEAALERSRDYGKQLREELSKGRNEKNAFQDAAEQRSQEYRKQLREELSKGRDEKNEEMRASKSDGGELLRRLRGEYKESEEEDTGARRFESLVESALHDYDKGKVKKEEDGV